MKFFNSFFTILAISAVALSSCAQPEKVDVAAVRAAIDAQNVKFAAAYNNQDAAGVASLYAQNATSMPPNSEILRGRAAIQESNQAGFDMGLKDMHLSTVSLEVHGDFAHEIGTFTIMLPSSGEEMTKDSGKYFAVWKRQAENTWLIHVDIWNSSLPLPGM